MSSDIDSISAISAASVQSEVSTRVARKTLDVQKDQGDAAIALLKSAEALSNKIAERGASADGRIDTYA